MRELYYEKVPAALRIFLRCWGIEGNVLRCKWGEFSADWGLAFQYSVYHETANINFCFIWGHFYIKAPMIIKQREGTEDWNANFGLKYHDCGLWWNWRTKYWVFHMPWDYVHVRHTILKPDGSILCDADELERAWEPPEEVKETHDYIYVLKSGEIQNRKATIYGEEREWRWRWLKKLPYPRMIQRTINVNFDAEVGEGTGSWKGGVLGTGHEWRHNETMKQALDRMQAEAKFSR